MKKVGLTGGIGSGKSFVSRVFSELGIAVFNADQQAKKAYSDVRILTKVRNIFGDCVFDAHALNFQKLSKIVFANKDLLEKLNAIIHPFTLKVYNEWLEVHANDTYIIMEAAIIFEAKIQNMFDTIICVNAPEDICIERVMHRDFVSEEEVKKRMQNQIPTAFKIKNSDFTLMNDEHSLILPQVLAIHNALLL